LRLLEILGRFPAEPVDFVPEPASLVAHSDRRRYERGPLPVRDPLRSLIKVMGKTGKSLARCGSPAARMRQAGFLIVYGASPRAD
jgi:hypothetical protein